MASKKPGLSFRLVQNDEIITISVSLPIEQLKSYSKPLWGIIGSGVIWLGSHFLNPPSPTLPPVNSPVHTAQPTIGK